MNVDEKLAEILGDLGIDLDRHSCALPDEFWAARDYLAHIRQAAQSRGRSAEAVLGTVLARVAAVNHHSIQLPPIVGSPCGLSLLVALVGRPGQGKGTGRGIGTDLVERGVILNAEMDNVPPGSGEGLPELLMGTVEEPDPVTNKSRPVRKQVHHNCFVYVDEGEVLARHTNRSSGSSIIPTLKSLFTSGPLGQANANSDRKRIIPGGSYVFGILLGIQPEKAGPIFDDAAGGLPQRFLWAATGGVPIPPPGERPDWPGPLDLPAVDLGQGVLIDGYKRYRFKLAVDVETEVLANDYQRVQHGCAELEEHQDLIRLKVAGILGIMAGRLTITEKDWALAGMIIDTSRATRDNVLDALADLRRQNLDRKVRTAGAVEVGKIQAVERDQISRCSRKIAAKVWAEPERWTARELRRSMSYWNQWFNAGLDDATTQGWVIETAEEARGNDKRALHPGPKRP